MNPVPYTAHCSVFFLVLANNATLAITESGAAEPLPGVDGNPGDGDIFPKERATQGGGVGHGCLHPTSQTVQILCELLFLPMEYSILGISVDDSEQHE